MKLIMILILTLVFPCSSMAVKLEDVRHYAIDYWPPGIDGWVKIEGTDVIAYTLKSDPCLIIESKEYGNRRYCQLPNNIDLNKSPKSIYIQRIGVGDFVSLIVIKNKKKYRCLIDLIKNEKMCKIPKIKSLYD